MHIETKIVPPRDLKPYMKNPRKNDHAVDGVVDSIKEFGFLQPILVDPDLLIITGHTRWKAALKAKLKEIPINIVSGLSEEQVIAYRIADNKYNQAADWDMFLLKGEIDTLLKKKFDATKTGFSEREINQQFGFDILDNPELASSYSEAGTYGSNSISLTIHNIKCFIDIDVLCEYATKLSDSLLDLYETDQKQYNAFGIRVLEMIKKNETKLL